MNTFKCLIYIGATVFSLNKKVYASPIKQNVECEINTAGHFDGSYFDVGLDSECIVTRSSSPENAQYGPDPFTVDDIDDAVETIPQLFPPNLGILLGITEIGCFTDHQTGVMDEYRPLDSFSIELCTNWGRTNNYQYIGLQSGGGCSGSNNFTKITIEKSDNCKTPCIIDPQNMCGGWLTNRIFHLGPNKIKNLLPLYLNEGSLVTINNPYYLFGITNSTNGTMDTVKFNPENASNLFLYYNTTKENSPAFDGILERQNYGKFPNSGFRVVNSTFPQSYTKSLWMWYDVPTNDYPNMLSSGGDAASNSSHYLFISNKKISAGHHTGFNQSVPIVQDNIKVPFKIWTHIAVTYNHSTLTMNLYRNGQLVSTGQSPYPDWNGDGEFQIASYRGMYSFTGYLAQVAVYDFALDIVQVNALYTLVRNIPIPIITPPPPPQTTSQLLGNGINYNNNASVMLGKPNVYLIWYGDFSGSNTIEIVTKFVTDLGGTPWYNIQTTYWQWQTVGGLQFISNALNYGGSSADPLMAYNKSLADSSIYYIVRNAITTGQLPLDANGVYLVMTAKDIKMASGFCTNYCGWHTAASMSGIVMKYGMIGDSSTQCPRGCMSQSNVSPNNNPTADAMISVVAHEIAEAVSDPRVNGWLDNTGYENCDKCAWNFKNQYTLPNGARANMNIKGRDYLVQNNFVNDKGGYCDSKYP